MSNLNERLIGSGKAVGAAAAAFVADATAPGAGSLAGFVTALTTESLDLIRQRLRERQAPLAEEFEIALTNIMKKSSVTPEILFSRQPFTTFATEALRIGLRKHQRETHVRLRFALITAALSNDQDHDLHMQYLRLLDELSERHVVLLDVICQQVESQIGFAEKVSDLDHSEAMLYLTPFASMQDCYNSIPEYLRKEISRIHFRLMISDLDRNFLVHTADADDFDEFQSGNSAVVDESSKSKPIAVTAHGWHFLQFIREG